MRLNKTATHILLLTGLAYVFLIMGNGIISLTNPDEVFYAQTAKEMIQRNSWMTPYMFGQPQFEKPILLYWMLRVGHILFGPTPFGARFFPAFFGLIGVIAVYLFGRVAFKDKDKSLLCAVILMSAGFYVGLARTVFTDMIFSVFILLALLSFLWGYVRQERKGWGIALFFVFSALAVLTKGPLGILVTLMTVVVFLLARKDLRYLWCWQTLGGLVLFLAVAAPWYALMMKQHGRVFTEEFFLNCHVRRVIEAEHSTNDTWHFYPLTMVAGMFPWSFFVIPALWFLLRKSAREENPAFLFLFCWICVVLVVFQPAHSKLTSYIFPLFPALAIIIGDTLFDRLNTKLIRVLSWCAAALLLAAPIGLLFAAAKYASYISSRWPLYAFIVVWLGMAALYCAHLFQRKMLRSFYILAAVLPVILFLMPFIKHDAEPYISSKNISEYLLANYTVESPIICSKMYARGVLYYTEKNVVVIDIPGKPYFSPHPVMFLRSDEAVRKFLAHYPLTYCILKKSSVEDMQRADGRGFRVTPLKTMGNEYLVKVERLR